MHFLSIVSFSGGLCGHLSHRTSFVFSVFFAALLSVGLFGQAAQAQNKNANRIDLRLFGKNVVEDYNGCHLAFWQHNKSPGKDSYPYVFYAPFNDGEELPGWMKIGKKVFDFTRRDKAQFSGHGIEPLRLYTTSKGTYRVVMEIEEQRVSGDDILIDKARLILNRSKRFPFVVSVKGALRCPASAGSHSGSSDAPMSEGLAGDAISLGRARNFDSLRAVPQGVLATIARDAPNCDPTSTPGMGASYAVSGAMTLWEVPCMLYARTGSSVFVTALNSNPNYSNILTLPPLPGEPVDGPRYEVRLPIVETASAHVSSEFYDGNGTCGSYERYQLRAVEGEALEFFLTEYRNQPTCDGRVSDPRKFPLVYQAN